MSPARRLLLASLAGAVIAAVLPMVLGTTSAAFSGSTSSATTFAADTLGVPGTPVSVHLSPLGGMVQLTWTGSSSSYVTGYTVQRATSPTGPFTTIASIPIGVSGFTEFSTGLTANSTPWDIVTGPDGNLWFTENTANKIGRITPSGVITEYAIPTAASSPKGITAGPDGNLWFTESASSKIGRITTSGVITEFALTAGRAPTTIITGPDGNLWFTEFGINQVARITTAGAVTEYAVGAGGNRPFGIAAGSDGSLWVTETAVNKLAKISAGGITETNLPGGSLPKGIIGGPSGNIRIAYSGSNKIAKFTPYADAVSLSETATPGGPTTIAPGPDGKNWYTENTGNKIASIASDDVVTEYAIPTAGSAPNGITAGPDGNIWFTETATHKIGRYGLNRSTSFVDTTASYNGQYHYRVLATYRSWTAASGTDSALTLPPSAGTDRTTGSPVALTAANLTSLTSADTNLFAPGAAWAQGAGYSTAQIHALQWGDASTAYAFGGSGTILKSTSGGVEWTAQASGTTNNLEGGTCLSASVCWSVGASGTIRYTSDGGSTWGGQTAAPSANLTAVKAVDSTHVWAVGASAAIRFFNGTAWGVQNPPAGFTSNLNDVTAVDASHAWAVGASGKILFFNGTAWAAQTSPSTKNLNSVWFVDANRGWITGDSGTILTTTDGGLNWTAQASPTTQHLRGICFVDATHGWASGDAGTVLFYNGTSWTPQTADAIGNKIQAVSFYNATTGLLGSDVSSNPKLDLQLTQDGGSTWVALGDRNVEVSFNATVATGSPVSSVKATLMYKTGGAPGAASFWLFASPDSGATWKYYPLPAGSTVTTTTTVDLSTLVNTATKLQNLVLRFYVAKMNGVSTSHDLFQLHVN